MSNKGWIKGKIPVSGRYWWIAERHLSEYDEWVDSGFFMPSDADPDNWYKLIEAVPEPPRAVTSCDHCEEASQGIIGLRQEIRAAVGCC